MSNWTSGPLVKRNLSAYSRGMEYNPLSGLFEPDVYWSLLDIGDCGLRLTARDYDDIQVVHDKIKAAGGGTLVLHPKGNYTAKADSPTIQFDTAFVGIQANRTRINVTALPNAAVAFNFYSSLTTISTAYALREFSNLWVSAGTTGDQKTTGPTAFRFDATLENSSVRIQLINPRVTGCFIACSFKSRAYFVRMVNPHFTRNRHALYSEPGAEDFAEKVTLINAVLDNNWSQITDVGGQLWTFLGGSIDYHTGYMFQLSTKSKVYLNSTHLEWNYGQDSGQVNCPITMDGEGAGVFMRGGSLIYKGTGNNPNYPAFITGNTSSQKAIFHIDKIENMGRQNNTGSLFDTFAIGTNNAEYIVELEAHADAASKHDVPAVLFMSETYGCGGQLRHGIEDPYSEFAHRCKITGSAVVSNVTADEGGVVRKNGKRMMKITGQGKVLICLPYLQANRRHGWAFHTATSNDFSGVVTIKELQTGFAPQFDHTVSSISANSVSHGRDVRGNIYSGTTITINSPSTSHTPRSWKDCNTSFYPSRRQNMAGGVFIEIDTSTLTGGALYLSYAAYDIL